MSRIAFYAAVPNIDLLDVIEFYKGDRDILGANGYDVVDCTTYKDVVAAKADLILAWWWHRSFWTALNALSRGVPLVVTGATNFRNGELGALKRLARVVSTAAVGRLATTNLAISEFELNDLARVRSRDRRRMYLGVDTQFYSFAAENPTHPSAAIVAQMNPASIYRKGVDRAIRVAHEVQRRVPDFQLHLIGPESRDGSLLLDDLLRDSAGILRHGLLTRDRKRAYLQSVNCYLQPSAYEGFGLSVAEAMSCGAVPLVSPAGSLPEVVGNRTAVVDGTDADWAKAIEAVLRGPTTLRRAAARASAERFSMDSRRDSLLELVDSLLHSKRHALPWRGGR